MDETSKRKSRRRECRVPQRPAYRRHTTTNTTQWSEQPVHAVSPLDGWRRVEVRERRTKVDWAHVIKKLVDEDYPVRPDRAGNGQSQHSQAVLAYEAFDQLRRGV